MQSTQARREVGRDRRAEHLNAEFISVLVANGLNRLNWPNQPNRHLVFSIGHSAWGKAHKKGDAPHGDKPQ